MSSKSLIILPDWSTSTTISCKPHPETVQSQKPDKQISSVSVSVVIPTSIPSVSPLYV